MVQTDFERPMEEIGLKHMRHRLPSLLKACIKAEWRISLKNCLESFASRRGCLPPDSEWNTVKKIMWLSIKSLI